MSPVAISPRDTATFAADLAETHYVDDATRVVQGVPTPGEPPLGEMRRHPSQGPTQGTKPVDPGGKTSVTRARRDARSAKVFPARTQTRR